MRIATFNVENLFTRFRFAKGVDPVLAEQEGFLAEDLRFRLHDAQAKRITADVLRALEADVVALQEVEDLPTLRSFRDKWLGGPDVWPHALVIDGNDDRRIDVGVLSRWPIVHARTWQHLRSEGRPVFDRDCLEVDIEGPIGRVTLYVNHFKSMRPPPSATGPGRAATRARRLQQVEAVKAIVQQRFGDDPGDAAFVVCGDFNDTAEDSREGRSALGPLLGWDAVEDVVARRPADDRWTHFWPGDSRRGLPPAYQQLDYLLVSRALAARSPSVPFIERSGMPQRADRYVGPRLDGVGRNRPKASDHCPVAFDLGPAR